MVRFLLLVAVLVSFAGNALGGSPEFSAKSPSDIAAQAGESVKDVTASALKTASDPYSYYGARYYDPRTSVWQSTDPVIYEEPGRLVGQSRFVGAYTYAFNHPVNLIDPDGRAPEQAFRAGLALSSPAALDADNAGQRVAGQIVKQTAIEMARPDEVDFAILASGASLDGPLPFGEILGVAAIFVRKLPKAVEAASKVRKVVRLNPNKIRFSQSSVNGAADLAKSMKSKGWVGDPVDVVELADGGLTTLDNTRVLAASRTGTDVKAVVHSADEALPAEMVERFTTSKGVPSTWGEAVELRLGKQNAAYRKANPDGSDVVGSKD